MSALRIHSEIPGERGIPGQNGGLPTLEALAQHASQLRIQRRKSRFGADALAIRRIRHDQAGFALGRSDLAERAFFHVQPVGNAGVLGIDDGHAHRIRVNVSAQNATAHDPCAASNASLCAQTFPQQRVVTAPTRETEIVAIERRRGIGRNQCAFGEKGAGTAHRIDQQAAAFTDARPARSQQNGGRHVFLERCTPALAAVAAPVQALAGEVHRQQGHGTLDVQMQQYVGAFRFDVWTFAGGIAQIVADRVLEQLRAVNRVSDGLVAPAAVAGQGRTRRQMIAPIDAPHGLVHALRTAGVDLSQAQ